VAEFLSSGSAIERAKRCALSVALPHANHQTEWTERGTVLHEFLEAVVNFDRETALAAMPDEYREACENLNLEGLDAQLSLGAEIAFAYNLETDTCRELGRGVGRAYDTVGIDEVPCTLDVVGVRKISDITRGFYADWKSGWRARKIAGNDQIAFGALCISRAYDCDVVDGQLIHVHEDLPPYVQRIVYERWELDFYRDELREHHARWKALRARVLGGDMPREYSTGPWCDGCSAREFCPAQTSQIRALIAGDTFDGIMRMSPIPDSALAELYEDIERAESALKFAKSKLWGIAAQRTVSLGLEPDGKSERWIGRLIRDGNEKLDGEAVYDVVAREYGDEAATAATEVVSSKKKLDAAIKAAVPRGQKAAAMRKVLDELRASGHVHRKLNTGPTVFSLPVGEKPADVNSTEERELAERIADQLRKSLPELPEPTVPPLDQPEPDLPPLPHDTPGHESDCSIWIRGSQCSCGFANL